MYIVYTFVFMSNKIVSYLTCIVVDCFAPSRSDPVQIHIV